MVDDDKVDTDPLSDAEIEAIRSHLSDAEFRGRVGRELRRWASWASASIITAFAIYKAIIDVIMRAGK